MKMKFNSPMPRRQFFSASARSVAFGALAAQSPVWSSAAARLLLPSAPTKVMLQNLTHAVFAAHLGDTFRLEIAAGQSAVLTLAEATNLAGRCGTAETGQREPFSLIFRAPADAGLAQQIYTLHHEQIGSFGVFLVPIGCDAGGLRCEAIFN